MRYKRANMLIRNKVANTTSPAMTQTSMAMPNIIASCTKSVLSSQFLETGQAPSLQNTLTMRHNAHHQIQIAHDAIGIGVAKIYISVCGLDVNNLVTPDVSSRFADAANAVSA